MPLAAFNFARWIDVVHRVEVNVQNIVKALPPLFEALYSGRRQCPQCGAIHPGKA